MMTSSTHSSQTGSLTREGEPLSSVEDRPMRRSRPPKLLDQMREALSSRHYSRRTEQTCCQWVKRYIFFHKVRHPSEVGDLGEVIRARKPKRLPVVMTRDEVKAVLANLSGASGWLRSCTCLLYTSDAADDLLCVDLGGRRIIK